MKPLRFSATLCTAICEDLRSPRKFSWPHVTFATHLTHLTFWLRLGRAASLRSSSFQGFSIPTSNRISRHRTANSPNSQYGQVLTVYAADSSTTPRTRHSAPGNSPARI